MTLLSLLGFWISLTGCTDPALVGLPASVFEREAPYDGETRTVGQLAQAYVTNTAALGQANNKLSTICLAAKRCKEVGSNEE